MLSLLLQSQIKSFEDFHNIESIIPIESLNDAIKKGLDFYSKSNKHSSVDELDHEVLYPMKSPSEGFFQGAIYESAWLFDLIENSKKVSDDSKPIGIILTKPPETIALVISPKASPFSYFLLFDSHSRPQFGLNGSYLCATLNLENLYDRINLIFNNLGAEDFHESQNLQTMMYNMYEATIFQI